MPITYDEVPAEVVAIADELIGRSYPELIEAEVNIGYLYARGGLKHHGYAAAATVKVCSLEHRKLHAHDCLITIQADDFDGWPSWNEDKRRAVLDHELYHLQVQRDLKAEGRVWWKTDDLGRPKLKLRLHDHQIGVFEEIVRRHPDASVELAAVRACVDALGQMVWDWAEGPRPRDAKRGAKARAKAEDPSHAPTIVDPTTGAIFRGPFIFAVRPEGQKLPTQYVRAMDTDQATAYLETIHQPGFAFGLSTIPDNELPKGATVLNATMVGGQLPQRPREPDAPAAAPTFDDVTARTKHPRRKRQFTKTGRPAAASPA